MGYYSEVELVLSKTGLEKLNAKLNASDISQKLFKDVNNLLDNSDSYEESNMGTMW